MCWVRMGGLEVGKPFEQWYSRNGGGLLSATFQIQPTVLSRKRPLTFHRVESWCSSSSSPGGRRQRCGGDVVGYELSFNGIHMGLWGRVCTSKTNARPWMTISKRTSTDIHFHFLWTSSKKKNTNNPCRPGIPIIKAGE